MPDYGGVAPSAFLDPATYSNLEFHFFPGRTPGPSLCCYRSPQQDYYVLMLCVSHIECSQSEDWRVHLFRLIRLFTSCSKLREVLFLALWLFVCA